MPAYLFAWVHNIRMANRPEFSSTCAVGAFTDEEAFCTSIRLHVTYIRNGFKLVLRQAFANFWRRPVVSVRTILAGRTELSQAVESMYAFGFQVIICRYRMLLSSIGMTPLFCRCRAFYSYNAGVLNFSKFNFML